MEGTCEAGINHHHTTIGLVPMSLEVGYMKVFISIINRILLHDILVVCISQPRRRNIQKFQQFGCNTVTVLMLVVHCMMEMGTQIGLQKLLGISCCIDRRETIHILHLGSPMMVENSKVKVMTLEFIHQQVFGHILLVMGNITDTIALSVQPGKMFIQSLFLINASCNGA